MINKKSFELFERFDNGKFIKPRYEDYSFGNIPNTIIYLLTREKSGSLLPVDCFDEKYPKPKKVVLFFVDSFGFKFWEKNYKQFNSLKKITSESVVTPISALFPSTTAASVSTMNLGVLPKQHALYEWNIYFEEYGEVIQTLPFAPLGESQGDKCAELGYDAKQMLAEHKTVYQKLEKHGVKSYQFISRDYAKSEYNKIIGKGAKMFSFHTFAEVLVNLRRKLEQTEEKSFFYFYWANIDSIAHEYSPESPEFTAEIANFWLVFDYVFNSYQKSDDTLFLFTADHGHAACDPKATYYLNLKIPEITEYLKKDKRGNIIYPNGSCRDVFLHASKDKVDALYGLLTSKLEGIAKVMLMQDALDMGFFGTPPYNEKFLQRLGQILILPYNGQYVWWYEKNKLETKYKGFHGGMSEKEMITVFGAW